MAVPPASRPKLAAVDTNVLIERAAESPAAGNTLLRLVGGGYQLIATSTVIQELANLERGRDSKTALLGRIALTTMRQWHVEPAGMAPLGNGICGVHANLLISRGYLPQDECDDAYVLLEASCWGAAMLVTWDDHLLQAARKPGLNELLAGFDLNPVTIVHPRDILGY